MVKSPIHGMVLASMFAALMAIGANIISIIPFFVIGGVPITLQTIVCILAGLLLGKKWGPIAMVIYLMIGIAGMPVFAQWFGGIGIIIRPTFGFLLSYILVAWVVGIVTEKNNSFAMLLAASFIGTAINYGVGTNWMYMAYKLWFSAPEGFTYGMAWMWMLAPLPKDIVLAVVAASVSYKVLQVFPETRRKNPTLKNEVTG
ncbi:biotin transporter BioY [Jeotgalibacillus soli]|uniref:Biotin transporter n=1 Tax=Jeotgalibacillus soli TaxID=889306 RepID=A0A0C2S7J2_9BACL|nr:biotin transporter BioY [Jeotgalibacillus soli]KIL49979.1 biotin biosynthesis protein BioC [Jeotgalibacillus soli]